MPTDPLNGPGLKGVGAEGGRAETQVRKSVCKIGGALTPAQAAKDLRPQMRFLLKLNIREGLRNTGTEKNELI